MTYRHSTQQPDIKKKSPCVYAGSNLCVHPNGRFDGAQTKQPYKESARCYFLSGRVRSRLMAFLLPKVGLINFIQQGGEKKTEI